MTCLCGKEALLTLADKVWCRSCFIDQFERRVKKVLREKPFQRGERVFVTGNVAAFVIKRIINMPLELVFTERTIEGEKAVVEWTLDDECVEFLERMSTDGQFKHDNQLKLFLHLRDSEVAAYAEMYGITFTPRKKNPLWTTFLSQCEPDMMYNLLRNAEELREMGGRLK